VASLHLENLLKFFLLSSEKPDEVLIVETAPVEALTLPIMNWKQVAVPRVHPQLSSAYPHC